MRVYIRRAPRHVSIELTPNKVVWRRVLRLVKIMNFRENKSYDAIKFCAVQKKRELSRASASSFVSLRNRAAQNRIIVSLAKKLAV